MPDMESRMRIDFAYVCGELLSLKRCMNIYS
jgi:hypothetical protein